MDKKEIRVNPYLYPMPVVLIGAQVDNKVNFMPIAWVSIVENKPPMISISSHRSHYTNKGIMENKTFSVNSPNDKILVPMDYCGLKSGNDLDKSSIFDVFYGELKTAPMIKEAPLNLECQVVDTYDTNKGHKIFFGEIKHAYADEEILDNGIPDMTKLQPVIFSMNDNNYWKVGKHLGRAWSIGREFKPE